MADSEATAYYVIKRDHVYELRRVANDELVAARPGRELLVRWAERYARVLNGAVDWSRAP